MFESFNHTVGTVDMSVEVFVYVIEEFRQQRKKSVEWSVGT